LGESESSERGEDIIAADKKNKGCTMERKDRYRKLPNEFGLSEKKGENTGLRKKIAEKGFPGGGGEGKFR